ncbi:MFS transporter [Deinococcus multiflagellatus]|uniref:MFS transporter n=1 Tax=Deinococcus multiflagellatus TaxID=1656887 RepID=UPI001CCCBBE3|nr:MFS transporter [Deinococcus multiflagellatus]MBZ9714723.1 MFS transporter [Deinococcus multiflagellatus]
MTALSSAPAAPTRAAPDRLTQATLLLLAALTVMSGATIAPALPAMQAHFADTPNAALLTKLALTILGVVIAVTAPISGVLADRFGRRPVLLGALTLYVLGGASGLVAESLGQVLAGRVVLGLAVAGTMTAAGALVNDLFSGPGRGRFLSQQAAFTSFGGAVLLPLGGVLAALSWRAPFALYLAAALLLPLVLRLPRGVPGQDAAGSAPQAAPRWSAIAVVYALALGYMIVFYLMPAQGPFLLRALGAEPGVTGLMLGSSTLMAAVTALVFSRFAGRFDTRRLAGLGMAIVALGWLLVFRAPGLAVVEAGLLVAGLGGGLVFPNLYAWLADLTPPAWRGRVTAGMSSAVFLGQFLSPLVLASSAGHEAQGFAAGAALAAVMGGALLALSLRPVPRAQG